MLTLLLIYILNYIKIIKNYIQNFESFISIYIIFFD